VGSGRWVAPKKYSCNIDHHMQLSGWYGGRHRSSRYPHVPGRTCKNFSMKPNPYEGLPACAFWKSGVTQENPYDIQDVYTRKFVIEPNAKIATAGSCFAQHVSRHLKANGYHVLDVEPPPPGLAPEFHQKYGYSTYSARYGNIYSVRQLLQLAREALSVIPLKNCVWEKNNRYYDAFRPSVEPDGLDSPEQVLEHRQYHLTKVNELFQNLDLFIFTLGLTEAWHDIESSTVYPAAPGTLAGEYDPQKYKFVNATTFDVVADFNEFQSVLTDIRKGRPFKVILTVSPVPLTATASGYHVLPATFYAKSTLRSAAGILYETNDYIDYFPSYEIATNPRLRSASFAENLRSIRDEAVANVMGHFFAQHPLISRNAEDAGLGLDGASAGEDVKCEESLMEAFGA